MVNLTQTERDTHRGWTISFDYGQFSAISPNYDASYEGPEDGWVDNGLRVFGRTREEVIAEIDAWIDGEAANAREIIAAHAGLGGDPYAIADRIIDALAASGLAIADAEEVP